MREPEWALRLWGSACVIARKRVCSKDCSVIRLYAGISIMMKRALLIGVVAAALSLAACGGNTTTSTSGSGGSATPFSVKSGTTISASGYSATLPGSGWKIVHPTQNLPAGLTLSVAANGNLALDAKTGAPTGSVSASTIFVHIVGGKGSSYPVSSLPFNSTPIATLAQAYFGVQATQSSSVTPFKTYNQQLSGAKAYELYAVSSQISSGSGSSSSSSSPAIQTVVNYTLFAIRNGDFYTIDVTCLPSQTNMTAAENVFLNLLNSWNWS